MKYINIKTLTNWLDNILQIEKFKDYCPNGLQVAGKSKISHIVTGVTANVALINAAIKQYADAILVHHGWFWKNEDPRILNIQRKRLELTLKNDLNVLAYHLPLDAHPTLGNNFQFAKILNLNPIINQFGMPITYGPNSLIWMGYSNSSIDTLEKLGTHIDNQLKRKPLIIGDNTQTINRIAWCTGAAQNMFSNAIEAGADVFITGEISEQIVHVARETGISFISAGHHATERYGIKALGNAINQEFGISVNFVDIQSPV